MDETVARGPGPGEAWSWRKRISAWRPRLSAPRWWRWPALARWQLYVLVALTALFVVWSGATLGFTKSYSAQVVVVDTGSIGIPPPLESLDFGDAPKGVAVERKITLENNSFIPLRVFVFARGDIGDFIHFDDAFFVLSGGEKHTITLKARPPASAEARKYEGRVFVVQTPWPFPW